MLKFKCFGEDFLFRQGEILFSGELNFKIRVDKNIYPDVKI